MDGLKYILREIEARRGLLHEFQKVMDMANSKEFILAPYLSHALEIAPEFLEGELADSFQKAVEDSQKNIKDSKEFTLFSEGVPRFVRDGFLTYKATIDAEQITITVRDFNTLYKKQFNDLRQYSYIGVPLWPNETPPDNYEINEMLGYERGGGFCVAWLHIQIWSPSIQQPDRQFYVSVEDRYVPAQRSSPKTEEGAAITPETYLYDWWKQDVGKQAEIVKGMQGALLYDRWKQDKRKAKPEDWPREIIINENTTSEQIWGQLLLSAFGQRYFSEAGETRAYEDLERHFSPEVLNRILTHLLEHSFNPYDSKSSMAYLKRLSRLFKMTFNQESQHFLYPNTEESNERLGAVPRYSLKGVFWASLETGMPKRTIYQLIKQGEIQADNSNSDLITLTDDAVDKLKKRADNKKKRKDIFQIAKLKGKSDEAIKKWLQRHRDLPKDEFDNELSLWLGVRQPQ